MSIETYKVSRSSKSEDTVVVVGDVKIGGNNPPVIMAGPCAIESVEHIIETAPHIKKAGADILRGGAYKPRSNPYSFQGLGVEGLKALEEAGRQIGMPTISEATEQDCIEEVNRHASMIQIGSRNGKSYGLIGKIGEAAARSGKPVLLKRAESATIPELLGAAEYLMNAGCNNIVLCLRGIRTFNETDTRYTIDVDDVPKLKEMTHLPIIYDPSHATGHREMIEDLAIEAIEKGADGLMIESHLDPDNAKCDADQQVTPTRLKEIIDNVRRTYNWLRGE